MLICYPYKQNNSVYKVPCEKLRSSNTVVFVTKQDNKFDAKDMIQAIDTLELTVAAEIHSLPALQLKKCISLDTPLHAIVKLSRETRNSIQTHPDHTNLRRQK